MAVGGVYLVPCELKFSGLDFALFLAILLAVVCRSSCFATNNIHKLQVGR